MADELNILPAIENRLVDMTEKGLLSDSAVAEFLGAEPEEFFQLSATEKVATSASRS